jgi:lipoprotein-anchoring transpeptidase ErfK/SrfK
MATAKLEPLKANARSKSAAFSKSLWRIAVLTAAGAIGVASQADATIFWPDSDGGFYQAAPQTMAPARKRRVRHHSEGRSEGRSRRGQKEVEAQVPETAKPHGPLVIAISINKQTMKIYDGNGFFAETPVSTGMRGHPTPMGVFSVVQKEKLHHSNIYSGAPMPYMQRITWSGIAMHAGVLPGHPASHGCIRMPAAFALKMYGWTRMGARVVITPDELVPTNFSHPMLVAQKVAPQPVAADAPAAKADKATNMATAKPAASEASLELRSTVGHDGGPKSLTDAAPASAPLREQTRTADASAFPITKSPVTMSDATSSGDRSSAPQQPVARADSAPSTTEDTVSAKSGDASSAEAEAAKLEPAKLEPAKSEAESAAAERAQITSGEGASAQVTSGQVDSTQVASTDDKAVEAGTPQAATAEIKSADTDADKAGKQPDQTAAAVPPSEDAAKTTAAASESIKADASKTEPKTDQVKTDQVEAAATNLDAPKPAAKPEDGVKAATAVSSVPDPKKDQGRLTAIEKAPAPKTAAEKRAAAKEAAKAAAEAERRRGPISVFVSRKDSKLYVRQGFAPLFDVPVTIAPGDRPLGTHVFTAEVDKDDANVVHWSVVTLPKPTRAERRDEDERASRRRKVAGAAEVKAPMPEPDSPAEALDRLTIPEEAKARITDALTTASSIIVSDQGIAGGETGQGTDFIVSLR